MDNAISRGLRWTMLALVTALALGAGNAWTAPADQRSGAPVPATPESGAKEPRCVHGCERWAKVCNVDPRGVYKCQRRCEKFGEICE